MGPSTVSTGKYIQPWLKSWTFKDQGATLDLLLCNSFRWWLMCGWPSVKRFSLLLVRRWCVSELLSKYFCWWSGGVDIWVATNENFLTKAHSFTSATTRMFWHKFDHTPLTTTKCFWPKVRRTSQTPIKLFWRKINHMSSLQLTQVFWYKGMSHTNNEITFTKGKSYMTTRRK